MEEEKNVVRRLDMIFTEQDIRFIVHDYDSFKKTVAKQCEAWVEDVLPGVLEELGVTFDTIYLDGTNANSKGVDEYYINVPKDDKELNVKAGTIKIVRQDTVRLRSEADNQLFLKFIQKHQIVRRRSVK